MCCFFLLFAALGPRFAIIAMWLFGNRVDLAFGSWLWPLLGLLVAPWTTLMYLLAWSPSVASRVASGSSSVSGLRSTWRRTLPSPPAAGTRRPEISIVTGPTSTRRPRIAHGSPERFMLRQCSVCWHEPRRSRSAPCRSPS